MTQDQKRPPRLVRQPLSVVFEEPSAFKETYGGGADVMVLEGQLLSVPDAPPADTVLLFMHPTGVMHHLPLPMALARAGLPVMTVASRYPHNDTALIMEKVALDLGRWVRHAKERLGFKKVVLAGWSGGGSLALFYQAQAERPSITETPAGDPVDVKGAGLIPADGVLLLAAHVSRAITLSEWIDPAIEDELDPSKRNPALDIYAASPPEAPPYSADFQAFYRAAQAARMARITAWAQAQLQDLRRQGRPHEERAFVVHGTMADLRWLDPAIDPNDRKPGWCYMGDPRVVNMSPAHLARYCALRSWLSQWSPLSRADGPACARDVSVPTLVVENTADDACTPSHAQRLLAGLTQAAPSFVQIKGATHYYLGQPEHLARAVAAIRDWLGVRGFATG